MSRCPTPSWISRAMRVRSDRAAARSFVVLHLEHPGVRVLQGQDPLAQVVAGGVQVLAGGLPLAGAQRQQRGDRPQGRRAGRGRLSPHHHHGRDRGAHGGGRQALPWWTTGTGPGEVVDGQRRAHGRGRRERRRQQVGGWYCGEPAPVLRHHRQSADRHGEQQPDHGGGVRPPHQDASAQDHAFVRQDLHAPIIGDRGAGAPRGRGTPSKS